VKIVRFHASDWLTNEINRRVRRAHHQGRITTAASHVIRELLHHAIAAQGAGRSKRALKARALRRPRVPQDLQGAIPKVAERDRELPAFGPDH